MHRAIRLTLPIAAAATALVLAGCGSDGGDDRGGGSPFSDGGSGGGRDEGKDDGKDGGDTGGATGGGAAIGGDGETVPPEERFEGDWYTGTDPSASGFEIKGESVTFRVSLKAGGGVCQGTLDVADNRMSLTSCDDQANLTWHEGAAVLIPDEEQGVLHVSWSSGTEMEMRNPATPAGAPGAFTGDEKAALGTTLDGMNGG